MTTRVEPVDGAPWPIVDYIGAASTLRGWESGLALTVPVDSASGTLSTGSATLAGLRFEVTVAHAVTVPLSAGTYYVSIALNTASSPALSLVVETSPGGTNRLPLWRVVRTAGAVTLDDIRASRAPLLVGNPALVPAPPHAGTVMVDTVSRSVHLADATAWTDVLVTTLSGLPGTIGTGFGWNVTPEPARVIAGRLASVALQIGRSGGTLTANATTGELPDSTLGTLRAELRPAAKQAFGGTIVTPGGVNVGCGIYLNTTGGLHLVSSAPGVSVTSGTVISVTLVYPL